MKFSATAPLPDDLRQALDRIHHDPVGFQNGA
jgi:hypothetical protein